MKRITRIALAAATVVFATALAAPAQAHDRHDRRHRIEHRHHKHHKHHQLCDHRGHRHDVFYRHDRRSDRRFRHDRFEIPQRIHDHRRHVYRPYFEGSVYFAPHRHRHSVYLFPVRIGRGWSFREHVYCDGDLFFDHARFDYHGRRFSISLGY